MIFIVLMLLFALIILVNLCIITACALSGENLYKKYGKQMLYIFGCFVFTVAALYIALAIIGLR